jgi:hypothetical protein
MHPSRIATGYRIDTTKLAHDLVAKGSRIPAVCDRIRADDAREAALEAPQVLESRRKTTTYPHNLSPQT